ncbi:hypothetical protein [Bacillus sp. TV3D]|uniref:hypothetical protein n=1 Tax=Bacillus sp. TV3D TaxID=3447562 RepID=UPI003EDA068A
MSQIKAYYIQLAEYDEKGNLHSYFFQNGKLKNKFHINQKGEFLKGSFTYGENGAKQDMMELNKKFSRQMIQKFKRVLVGTSFGTA